MFRASSHLLWLLSERELEPPATTSSSGETFRRRSIPPLRRTIGNGETTNTLSRFLVNNYSEYYRSLPPYPRYLFRKLAYSRTGECLERFSDDVELETNEWADKVYLTENLLKYLVPYHQRLRFEITDEFVTLVDAVDSDYVNENHNQLDQQVEISKFLLEIIPRLPSKKALIIYEEYLPDWYRILREYQNLRESNGGRYQNLRESNGGGYDNGGNLDVGEDHTGQHRRPPRQRGVANVRINGVESTVIDRTDEELVVANERANNVQIMTVGSDDEEARSDETSTRRPNADDSSSNDIALCRICYNAERCTIYLPCRHCVSCVGCTINWLRREQKCPLCAEESTSYISFYFS